MTTLTLLVKASSSKQIEQIEEFLTSEFEELDVELTVHSNTINRWVQIEVSGEDEGIATSFIKQKIGVAPTNLACIEKDSVHKGFISKVDLTKQALKVDIGVFQPKNIQATIPLPKLTQQLAAPKDSSLKKICETFGLVEELPLTVKINTIGEQDGGELEAELAESEVVKFGLWRESLLDRLIVLRVVREDVDWVLERARLGRDVVDVEALGLFEHVLTCKLGTDAAGLIPRVGRFLRFARFVVFNSRRVHAFLGEEGLSL